MGSSISWPSSSGEILIAKTYGSSRDQSKLNIGIGILNGHPHLVLPLAELYLVLDLLEVLFAKDIGEQPILAVEKKGHRIEMAGGCKQSIHLKQVQK